MRPRLLLPALAALVVVCAGAIWSKYQPRTRPDESRPAPAAHVHAAFAHADMGPHMRMTAARTPRPGDEERAGEIAARARRAVERYQDYRAARRAGFEILQPEVRQRMYHFNHAAYYAEAERRFNVEHPTSLLYEKDGGRYRLIGVMYTAPADLTEDELDGRIPLSVARWHQHVNVCLPEGDPLQNLFGQGGGFGLEGSISTEEECRKAGGHFYPRLFGWMVHLYPYERTAREMWSVERQLAEGSGHMH